MKKLSIEHAACVFTLAAALAAPCLLAQQASGLQASFGGDVGTLSDKFTGLARVLAPKYDYRPGQGVRSTADVLNLIVMENGMLAAALTGAAPGARPAPINDAAQMQDALKNSYGGLRKAVEGLSDADLKASVKFFGRDTTKQGALLMLLFDQHEHLGQLIAYSRTNGIVPPWSK